MKMSADFLTRLQKSAVLCDGAMGTLLYSKGIFINRCYDELNLSQPDLIRGVHRNICRLVRRLLKPILLVEIHFVWPGTAWPTGFTKLILPEPGSPVRQPRASMGGSVGL